MKRLLVVPLIVGLLPAFFLTLSIQTGLADSATWRANPQNDFWINAANWIPMTVPSGPSDTATFDSSNQTSVSISTDELVLNGIIFNPSASAYDITVDTDFGGGLRFTGVGITNNSGILQNFVILGTGFDRILFSNGATAGSLSAFTVAAGSGFGRGGELLFFDNSTAGSSTFITNEGGTASDEQGGQTAFLGNSSANDCTIINNGGTASGTFEAETEFFAGSPTAANATLIANSGEGGGKGGRIRLEGDSKGGSVRVEVFGDGNLDISLHNPPGIAIGSIEGDGIVFLGANNLTVGSNHLSTNFSGVIRDRGIRRHDVGGSLTKIGTGKLVLSHRNIYTGGTTVKRGRLIVNNIGASGTGSGPVEVNGGRLGGMGTIAGAVTIGSRVGREAVLSPGYHHSFNPGTLTIQSPLTFNSDGTYEIEVNSSSETVDKVVAFGVTINAGAQTLFADLATAHSRWVMFSR
jgi:autotransporter-associated beta strand protein